VETLAIQEHLLAMLSPQYPAEHATLTFADLRLIADADSGDIVAAMLENDTSGDREATVKMLKEADGHAWLIPHKPGVLADPGRQIGDHRQRRQRPASTLTIVDGQKEDVGASSAPTCCKQWHPSSGDVQGSSVRSWRAPVRPRFQAERLAR
jgi:hypothetical protein